MTHRNLDTPSPLPGHRPPEQHELDPPVERLPCPDAEDDGTSLTYQEVEVTVRE